jgi:hypothetical protein
MRRRRGHRQRWRRQQRRGSDGARRPEKAAARRHRRRRGAQHADADADADADRRRGRRRRTTRRRVRPPYTPPHAKCSQVHAVLCSATCRQRCTQQLAHQRAAVMWGQSVADATRSRRMQQRAPGVARTAAAPPWGSQAQRADGGGLGQVTVRAVQRERAPNTHARRAHRRSRLATRPASDGADGCSVGLARAPRAATPSHAHAPSVAVDHVDRPDTDVPTPCTHHVPTPTRSAGCAVRAGVSAGAQCAGGGPPHDRHRACGTTTVHPHTRRPGGEWPAAPRPATSQRPRNSPAVPARAGEGGTCSCGARVG